MFTLGRHDESQVFYDLEYLQRSLEPFFRTRAVVKEAYSYQTALLLERLQRLSGRKSRSQEA